MGAREMVEKIKDEAHEEREKLISEARDEGNKKLEEAKKEIEVQKKRFTEAEERKGIEEKERIVRAARQNARKLKWTAEEGMIEKALAEALTRIKEIKRNGFKGNSYAHILAGLIQDSTLSITSGSSAGEDVEVLLSEEDADAAYIDQSMLKKLADDINQDRGAKVQLSLSDETIKSTGGVIVRRKDGTIEVNNTFEQRMTRFSTSLREEIVKALFTER